MAAFRGLISWRYLVNGIQLKRERIMKPGTMVRSWAMAAAAFLFAMIAAAHVYAAEDAARPAELKVLDRWAGAWDVEITVNPNARTAQVHKAIYESQVLWALNDRFLRS